MTSPNAIDDVKIPSPEFFDNYDTGEFIAPPQVKIQNGERQTYIEFAATLPSAEKIKTRSTDGAPLKTNDGYFKVVLEDVKIGGGYVINQTHIGTKQYNKKDKAGNVIGQRNSSPFGDFLKATGVEARPASVEEYEALAKGVEGRVVRTTLDWSAWDSDNQQSVANHYEDFPQPTTQDQREHMVKLGYAASVETLPVSFRLPYIEKGGKKFWARAGVKRWVSAV